MKNPVSVNDFKKAMGSILLTAGATLADVDRITEKATNLRRGKVEQDFRLAAEFCRLLIAPVDQFGPGFAEIAGVPESYCRKHLARATDFLRQTMATQDAGSAEAKRLKHIAGLIEKALMQHLDEKTAIRCWFGDQLVEANSLNRIES